MQAAYAMEATVKNEFATSTIAAILFLILFLAVCGYILFYWFKTGSTLRWLVVIFCGLFIVGIAGNIIPDAQKYDSYLKALQTSGMLFLGVSIMLIILHYLTYLLRKIFIFSMEKLFPSKYKLKKEPKTSKPTPSKPRLLLVVDGNQRDITDLPVEQQIELLQSLHEDYSQSDLANDTGSKSQKGGVSIELIHNIVLSIIALSVAGIFVHRLYQRIPVDKELWSAMTFILGYFFGTQSSKYTSDSPPQEEKKALSQEEFTQILETLKERKE